MAIQRVTAGQTEIATSGSLAATLHPWGLGTFQGPYQLPPLLGDGADVHGVALHHVQEPHFRDGDGADHMDPPGGAERVGSGVTGALRPLGVISRSCAPAGQAEGTSSAPAGPAPAPNRPSGHPRRRVPSNPPPVSRHLQGASPEVAQAALLQGPDNSQVRGVQGGAARLMLWDLLRPPPTVLTFQTSGHRKRWAERVRRAPPETQGGEAASPRSPCGIWRARGPGPAPPRAAPTFRAPPQLQGRVTAVQAWAAHREHVQPSLTSSGRMP